MKNEKDKKFARWLVKVLLPGYHLQKDRPRTFSEFRDLVRGELDKATTEFSDKEIIAALNEGSAFVACNAGKRETGKGYPITEE